MSFDIVFEDLETHFTYTSIESFKQSHRGFKLIQRQTISFEGLEDIDHPVLGLILDGVKIPRYKLSILFSDNLDLDPLTSFLDSKRAFWMISSIDFYIDNTGTRILKTGKVEMFLRQWKSMLAQLASKQINQLAPPPQQMPVPPPAPPPQQMPVPPPAQPTSQQPLQLMPPAQPISQQPQTQYFMMPQQPPQQPLQLMPAAQMMPQSTVQDALKSAFPMFI